MQPVQLRPVLFVCSYVDTSPVLNAKTFDAPTDLYAIGPADNGARHVLSFDYV